MATSDTGPRLKARNPAERPGAVAWLTGLPGAGKSSIARAAADVLRRAGCAAFVLDGDELRRGLCSDLTFSPADRSENLRRAGAVAGLLADAGLVVFAAFITPEQAQRDRLRHAIGGARFVEVFVDTPLAVCEKRDPKGLYRRARAGELRDFTGVDARYEAPLAPDLVLPTHGRGVQDCADLLVDALVRRGLVERRQAGGTG